jgi:arabinogalactan endo-1,4-beta-galactosidase
MARAAAGRTVGMAVRAPVIVALMLLAPLWARGADYAVGADVSFMGRAEQQGIVFADGGKKQPALHILHEHGYRWIRLRLFHTPTDLPNNLAYTIALAKDAKALGMKFLLDYHYADSWADPQQQPIPRAWAGLSHAELTKAVFEYTRDTVAAFRDAGVLPDMIQIGNEITHGMLWPDGKLPENWDNFAQLVYAGINGMDAGRGNGMRPKIMIHIDRGADMKGTKEFLDKLDSYDVPYDVIGQSYYPWFHGSLNELHANLSFMAAEYQKDIIVVETAYNWKPAEYVGKDAPFPESPEGQRQFLDELNRVVMQTPNGRGKGIFWWEPAVSGRLSSRGYFDDQHNALPVLGVFDRFTRK